MHIIKYFALQRGVKSLSYSDITMPVDIALDDDQMAPLLVASATYRFNSSGLFNGTDVFPWTLAVEPENQVALLNGTVVKPSPSPVPKSVGYLFIDYEFERLVLQHMLNNSVDEAPDVLAVDSLIDRLEEMENEPRKHTPFNLEL